jgi:hypothetical protein
MAASLEAAISLFCGGIFKVAAAENSPMRRSNMIDRH